MGASTDEIAQLEMDEEEFPLPSPTKLSHPPDIPLRAAAERLSVPTEDYVGGARETISEGECGRLAQEVHNNPEPATAAALAEAALNSRYRILRTAGATAALGTTGPRPDIVAELEASTGASDPLIRDVARTALARVAPRHERLQRVTAQRRPIRRRSRPSNTAVLSHGTFASNSHWWRPGGGFYGYLDGLSPPLHMHDESYRWSGDYSSAARDLAAADLVDWTAAQQLVKPDFIAHSHGATVANLATTLGQEFQRLVMLALPMHQPWLPDLDKVEAILDVRVKFDLVILADFGGQRLPSAVRNDPKVTEERNGWFDHGDPHEGDYWDKHGLPDVLAGLP